MAQPTGYWGCFLTARPLDFVPVLRGGFLFHPHWLGFRWVGQTNFLMKTVPPSREVHYEFGGPIGAALITISLPFVVLGLCFVCG